jgi:hypothetical protein
MKKIFILCFSWLSSCAFAQTSVLSSGDWYKIGIVQTGIHKIDATFLKNIGINTTGINPQHLKIYGNGGRMLPQKNSDFRHEDLTENAIWISGESDGKFDDNDYILFFAQSPHEIIADNTSRSFSHRFNIYSDTTYYFITVSNKPSLRITPKNSQTGTSQTVTSFDDYFFYEKDNTNLLQSGRDWFDSDRFETTTERKYNFSIPGLISGSPFSLSASFANAVSSLERGSDSSAFVFSINGKQIGKEAMPPLDFYRYNPRGVLKTLTYPTNTSVTGTSENIQITLNFLRQNNGNPAVGYLNYLGINAKRELKLYDKQTRFRNFDNLSKSLLFSFPADNTIRVWDVTNPLIPKEQAFTLSGSQGNFGSAIRDTLPEFIMFSGSAFQSPVSAIKISNQNLHALATPDLLIISPDGLLPAATQLASFRRTHDGLNVAVATVSQIFNEFSSGMQDITGIRDFIRFLYKKGNLRYVLLFGDASYDYKSRISARFNYYKNTIPVYESRNSLSPTETYSSDDYFGFMEDFEGEWIEDINNTDKHTLDVGIGRLPLETLTQAQQVVDKLIYYSQNSKTLGKWRQKVNLVADDGDSNQHQKDAEYLADKLAGSDLEYNPYKIYLDNYLQISSGNAEKVPDANTAIDRAVTEGSLIVNYAGHGGEIGWAQEQVLTISQILNYRNLNSMPLFVTATCEFGRYDDPLKTSGAELLILNANGGGIGLLTTTRPVFSSTNLLINSAFYDAVFLPVSGEMPRLGDVIKSTKNKAISGVYNRNFALLGDPSLRLAYPQQNVKITKINNKVAGTDTLKAMGNIRIEGEIRDNKDLKIGDFNGILYITVFDKEAQGTTLGQEGLPMTYTIEDRVLYEGKATVTNGTFNAEFVLPKDIDYKFGYGKISLYAQSTLAYQDAGGFLQPVIGGTATSAPADDTPPLIKLYMDNENFVSGNTVSESPVLIAHLSDDSGINVSQVGIGHEISAVLDHQSENSIILNEYYIPETDTYKSGLINYPFKNLAEGKHNLSVKAWDTHNNSATSSLDFIVTKAGHIHLKNVFAYPNPASGITTFRFEHDREGDNLELNFEIFDSRGRSVKHWKTEVQQSNSPYDGYDWHISDESLVSGLYIYRLIVRSLSGNITGSYTGKLIVTKD